MKVRSPDRVKREREEESEWMKREIRFEQVKTEQYICIKDELEGMWWWEFENLTVPVWLRILPWWYSPLLLSLYWERNLFWIVRGEYSCCLLMLEQKGILEYGERNTEDKRMTENVTMWPCDHDRVTMTMTGRRDPVNGNVTCDQCAFIIKDDDTPPLQR